MNCLTISGTLTCNPKFKIVSVSGNETKACDLSVAVKTNNDISNFKVTVYREKADLCSKLLTKGDRVVVRGPVKLNMFVNENNRICGNLEVFAEEIEFDKQETELEATPVVFVSEEEF